MNDDILNDGEDKPTQFRRIAQFVISRCGADFEIDIISRVSVIRSFYCVTAASNHHKCITDFFCGDGVRLYVSILEEERLLAV